MSTLRLPVPAVKVLPAPMLAGCRVEVSEGARIDSALRQLKRVCERNGRRPGRWNVVGRDYPETRGQKCRRKHKEAIARRKGKVHRDP